MPGLRRIDTTVAARAVTHFFETRGLVPLNVFHGLYPKQLRSAETQQLFAHLNSEAFQRRLRRAARTYGAGLMKIEPRELAAVRVPDVRFARERGG